MEGIAQDVFIKDSSGEVLHGRVWPTRSGIDPETGEGYLPKSCDVAYPDYYHPNTKGWWITEMKDYHNVVEYDAIWIDMNEPSNFMDGRTEAKGRVPNSKFFN